MVIRFKIFQDCNTSKIDLSGCNNSEISQIHPRSCSASTEYDDRYNCDNVYDGLLSGYAYSWATRGQQVGAWIQINLDSVYTLTKVMARGRSSTERFKDITLQFGDGSSTDFTLSEDQNTVWNEIVLSDMPTSNYVKISANTVYGGSNIGFREVRIFGCYSGKMLSVACNNCIGKTYFALNRTLSIIVTITYVF